MVRLILAGGGDAPDSKAVDEFFIKLIPKGKVILYIPIAMTLSEEGYDECYEWIQSTFKPLNFTDIVMWTDLHNKRYEDLEPFGAIYIGGGNTFSLLNELRKTGFIALLKKYITNDGLVYGGSAGAIILGKNIETSTLGKFVDENKINLTNTSGLNYVNGCNIHCHYDNRYDKEMFDYIEKHNSKVIAIPEKSGLFIENSKMMAIGFEPIFLFKNGKKSKI